MCGQIEGYCKFFLFLCFLSPPVCNSIQLHIIGPMRIMLSQIIFLSTQQTVSGLRWCFYIVSGQLASILMIFFPGVGKYFYGLFSFKSKALKSFDSFETQISATKSFFIIMKSKNPNFSSWSLKIKISIKFRVNPFNCCWPDPTERFRIVCKNIILYCFIVVLYNKKIVKFPFYAFDVVITSKFICYLTVRRK